jgi:Tfp pilus assembly protein PilN
VANTPGINLLPEEGREDERRKERNRLLSFVSIGILLVVGGLTAATYAYTAFLTRQDESYRNEITETTKVLDELKSVENLYRTINNKLIRLQGLIASYPKNSFVLDDIAAFTPSGVSLTSLTFDTAGKLTVSGSATNPTTFGDFVNILKDPKQGGMKFTNVEIVSVAGGGTQGDYRFSLSMGRKGGT